MTTRMTPPLSTRWRVRLLLAAFAAALAACSDPPPESPELAAAEQAVARAETALGQARERQRALVLGNLAERCLTPDAIDRLNAEIQTLADDLTGARARAAQARDLLPESGDQPIPPDLTRLAAQAQDAAVRARTAPDVVADWYAEMRAFVAEPDRWLARARAARLEIARAARSQDSLMNRIQRQHPERYADAEAIAAPLRDAFQQALPDWRTVQRAVSRRQDGATADCQAGVRAVRALETAAENVRRRIPETRSRLQTLLTEGDRT